MTPPQTTNGAARRPMRLVEIETFGRGGLIHYAYNLSCALAQRGHEIILFTAAGYELENSELATRLPANVRLVKKIGRFTHRRGGRWPAFLTRLTRQIEAIVDAATVALSVRRLRPDIVHLHCTNPISLLYILLLRLVGAPLVATAHVVTPHERIRFENRIYRLIHRWSPRIIAHSEFDRARLLTEFDVDPEQVTVIPHGEYGFFEREGAATGRSEARRSFGLEPEDEVALFFGYIREYKGLDLLLEAWAAVSKARPRARLLVAGDPVRLGPERRAELEAWATRLGAVHTFGYIPFAEVPRYFGAADVLVMPYRHISQSGVLYLALSLGVPVLGTRVGALPEVLRDGDSGLLVPPESPAALAQALLRILGDPELRKRLAQGGHRVADEHSWPAIAERTEAVFAKLAQAYREKS